MLNENRTLKRNDGVIDDVTKPRIDPKMTSDRKENEILLYARLETEWRPRDKWASRIIVECISGMKIIILASSKTKIMKELLKK